jgi:hypothetical protein
MPEIERSLAWIIAAVVLAIGFITGLGPGVKLHLLRRVTTLDIVFQRAPEPGNPETMPQRIAIPEPSSLSGLILRNALAVTVGCCREANFSGPIRTVKPGYVPVSYRI